MSQDKQLLEQEAERQYPYDVLHGASFISEQLIKRKAYIAGATSSSTVKTKDERIKELEDGIKWALDNPQSVFVFNELQKLL